MLTSALLHRVALLLAAEYPNIIQTDIERDVNVQTHWVRGGEKASPNIFCQVSHAFSQQFESLLKLIVF